MKMNDLEKRLQNERPMREIVLNIPKGVCEDLSRIATKLGFSNSEALMRAYIGQGLRLDLERFESLETAILSEKSLADNWDTKDENKAWLNLEKLPPV